MTQTAHRHATYEDLFDLPEHVIGEILHGQLVTQPRPAPKHALAAAVIGLENAWKDDERVIAAPFGEVELPLGDLWVPPPPDGG